MLDSLSPSLNKPEISQFKDETGLGLSTAGLNDFLLESA